jgi:hypothetical protein
VRSHDGEASSALRHFGTPFENVVATTSLFRAPVPEGQRDDTVAHAIALVEKAIVQQVNGASDSGRLY